MLTLFTTPKAFDGHIGVIQRNAITSWTRLDPRVEVILLGRDAGTAELGIRHEPDVACNDVGVPLVNALFGAAARLARHRLLCYVNADIILFGDFVSAVDQVARQKATFMMVGRRTDFDQTELIDFASPDWETKLRADVQARGVPYSMNGSDYFVFPAGLLGDIPPFAIGRTAWDNWLMYRTRQRRAALVDATIVTAVHQNHGYRGGKAAFWATPEAQQNKSLLGDVYFTLEDATHTLERDGTLRWSLERWPRHLEQIGVFLPGGRVPRWAFKQGRRALRYVRRALQ